MPTLSSRRPRAVAALTALSVTFWAALAGATSPAGAGVDAAAHRRPPQAAAKQKTSITVLPPISQAGKKAGKAKKAKTVVTATFTPAKKNRPVTLFVKSGGSRRWPPPRPPSSAIAEFSVPDQEGRGLQGHRGPPTSGLPAVTTKTAKNTWKGADFVDEFGGSTLGADWTHRAAVLQPGGPAQLLQGRPVRRRRHGRRPAPQRPRRPGARRRERAPPSAVTAPPSGSSSTASTGTSRPTATTTSATAWPRPG